MINQEEYISLFVQSILDGENLEDKINEKLRNKILNENSNESEKKKKNKILTKKKVITIIKKIL